MSWAQALAFVTLAGRWPLSALASLAILQAALPLVGLVAMKQLVDAVADGIGQRITVDVASSRALWATGLAAGTALIGATLQNIAALVQEQHGRHLGDRSQQQLQEHCARLPLRRFDEPGFHDLLHRAGSEAGQRPVRLLQDLIALLVAILSLGLMAFVLARVELWLPLAVGLAAAPIAWARSRHARQRFAWHREHVVEQREVGYLGAVLTGRATAKDVRLLGLLEPLGARLRDRRRALRRSLLRLAQRRARDDVLVSLLASGALFGAYVYLAFAAFAGAMTLGGLVLHAQAAQRTQNAVRDLLAALAAVREHRLFLAPVRAFLDLPTDPPVIRTSDTDTDAHAPGGGAASYTVRGLHFAYPGMPRPLFADFDLNIASGERIAIVGANGSGKSTLIKLLLGLYAPDRGQLLRRGGPPAALLQDAAAFELTLRENLQLGQPASLSDADLWRALDLVGLGARVRALPRALDTPWSRRLQDGVDWSVGEARRIVLARTLATPARTVLLDEPFASLDGSTAQRIAEHLRDLPTPSTLVLVDHRGPALEVVDRVIWLRAGKVVADGSPTALRRRSDFTAQFPEWRS